MRAWKRWVAPVLFGAAVLAVGCPAPAQVPADRPELLVPREMAPVRIGAGAPFAPGSWVPLMSVNWERADASTDAWLGAGWNEQGLHVALVLPHASDTSRMQTGLNSAPFAVDLEFGGGEGPYGLRCVPLTEPVSRMITRSQPYLFNARLGANARLGETGQVLCQEVTQRGILPDSLRTRWRAVEGGGLRWEALVPWRTLRLAVPEPGRELPFRIRVEQAGRGATEWGGAARTGHIRLGGTGAQTTTPGSEPLLRSTAVRQPLPLAVAFPEPGERVSGSWEFTLLDSVGGTASRAGGRPAGAAVIARLATARLPDGRYTVRVRRGGAVLGERAVRLIGRAAEMRVEQPRARLAARLDGLAKRELPAWAAGHLARARLILRLAALPAHPAPADLDRSAALVADATAIIASLEGGRRPDPSREGYTHPAGFAADGQRGPVRFVPTESAGARLTVHAARRPHWRVTPFVYGTFSEPVVFDRPIYSLLYAQRLRNPSFEWGHPSPEQTTEAFIGYEELDSASARAALDGRWLPRIPASLDQVAAPWIGVGRGSVRFELAHDAFNDRTAQRITAAAGARGAGVAQVVTLPAWRATRYHLRGWLRSDGRVRTARALLLHDGRSVDSVSLGPIGTGWQRFEADLRIPKVPGARNTFLLALVFDGPGRLDADMVTLAPDDAVDGFDPQAVAQLRALHTGWVRWPGGNYASGYHWRDGVGPPERRPSTPNLSWPGLNSNAVGTDEFLRLCERIGITPMLTVNAGDGTPEEAAQWVEYVNGDTTTPMGRLRALNGHPAPYGVRYWNVGNELWGFWQIGHTDPQGYARRYAEFARAMRAVDPSIRLIANGHGGHSESPPEPWNRPLLEQDGARLDMIDVHTYVGVPRENLSPGEQAFLLSAIPLSYEQWLMGFRQDLLQRGLGKVRVVVGEYNGSIRSGSREMDRIADLLVYAGYLHCFLRQGESVFGANATEYSPFDPRALPFGRMHPRYQLFRTYAQHAGTQPVAATLETPTVQQQRRVGRDVIPIFNLPVVDAVVLADTADGSLGISLLNRELEKPVRVEVRLPGFRRSARGQWFLFGSPSASAVSEGALPAGETFTVTLPPHSVSLLKLYASASGVRERGRCGAREARPCPLW